MDVRIQIRGLERSDIRDAFNSGDPSLDLFLRLYAGQNQWRHHIAMTYAAVEDSTRVVVGFVTVAGTTIEPGGEGIPRVPYPDVPAVRISRLAVDRRFQNMGIGQDLTQYAFRVALAQAELSGCAGVVVDAKPEAVGYYEQFGFRQLDTLRGSLGTRPRLTMMYLGLRRIKAALDK